MRHARLRPLLVLLLAGCGAAPAPLTLRSTSAALEAQVTSILAEVPTARAALWLGPADGDSAFAREADRPMPSASAIKTAYLLELFAAHRDDLDAPFPGASAILADPTHPAVAHFTQKARATALRDLGRATVRRMAEAMIRGTGVDNATYNIAANLVTARFGGPTALGERLRGRGAAFRELAVRRYMLADRTANGDNEASARALALVLGQIANGTAAGLDEAALLGARAILRSGDGFQKGGSLDSTPVTRVASGWWPTRSGPVVYVVMLADDRRGSGGALQQAVDRLLQALRRAAPE